MMKKFAGVITAITMLVTVTEAIAQPVPPPAVRRNRAANAGRDAGISGAAIAAGLGVIVAIVAVALVSNNSHSH